MFLRDGVQIVYTSSGGCAYLILNERIEPTITDYDVLKINLYGTRNVLCVLVKKVRVEDRTIMSSVALCCEVEAVACIIWECAHKTLERPPHIGRSAFSRVGCQRMIRC